MAPEPSGGLLKLIMQVHYPSDPLQPGSIYFLTPRKCGLCGVCCEAFPRQVTYLVDEAMDTEKGANTVVSYVHHYIENHGVNASMIHLNADNCTGQNNHHFTQEKHSLLQGDFLAQESIDSSIRKVSFLREDVTLLPSDTLPEVVLPKGLSAERQWYLYEKIRSFCPDNSKDKTCPLPSVAKPLSSAPEAPSLAVTSMGVPPAPKRRRKCGLDGYNCQSFGVTCVCSALLFLFVQNEKM